MKALKDLKAAGKGKSSTSVSVGYETKNKKGIKLSWHGNNPNDRNGEADDDITVAEIKDGDPLPGMFVSYESLPSYVQDKVKDAIGGGNSTFTGLGSMYYKVPNNKLDEILSKSIEIKIS